MKAPRRCVPIAIAAVVVCSMWVPCLTLAQSPSSEASVGIPWHGEPGITESVANIMAREAQVQAMGLRAAHGPRKPVETHRRLLSHRENLPQNPDALKIEPTAPGHGSLLSTSAPQTVGTSFIGATLADSGFIPPDSMGAVGPTQFLVCVNGRIRIFDKTGVLGALDATTDAFFASVRGNAGTSDPRVVFDRQSGRWIVVMINVANTSNRVLIAVSSGPTITSASSFSFFQFQQDLVGPTPNSDTGLFADYPSLGVDTNALYIGANMFAGNTFHGTTGFVVRKSDLLGGSLTVTAFRQLATSTGSGPFAPRGVSNDDPNATEGYFVGSDNAFFGLLDVRRISTPGGVPTISGNLVINVPATSFPANVPAQGSSFPLDALDDRLYSAVMKNGSLWTAHNIGTNATGTASSPDRTSTRWYEIISLASTPTLNQSGTLFDASASNPNYFWMGSVAASGQGHMALGASYAGTASHAGVILAGRLATDPLGTLETPTFIASSTSYNVQAANPQRWGDYSFTSVDPTDDMTMWTVQEICNATNSWGVYIAKLVAPPPAMPSSASPSTASPGSTVSVVVAGTSTNGSGFFDPGPGFANHIAATVNGGGVTVNGVTFTNATSITLNLTVASNALAGTRTITVTNPDGQSATSSTGIFTVAAQQPLTATCPANTGQINVSYFPGLVAMGGTPPYSLSIISGALPPGLAPNSSRGTITGKPTTAGNYSFTAHVTDSASSTANTPSCSIDIAKPTPAVLSSCLPSSSVSVLVQGHAANAYIPNGSWQGSSNDIRLVPLEGSQGTAANIPTPSPVNSCASNWVTGETVCTGNSNAVYLIKGSTVVNTLTSGGFGTMFFTGGQCTNCGVAMDASSNQAVIATAMGNGVGGFQVLDLGTNSFEPPIQVPGETAENIAVDPLHHLVLSPNEGLFSGSPGYFILQTQPSIVPFNFAASSQFTSSDHLASAAEDCTTGIALATDEGTSKVFIADLTQATFDPISGTWDAPNQLQNLPEFGSLSNGTAGLAVAPGSRLGLVTGEFCCGGGFGSVRLPSSGTGTPAIVDYVEASMPNDPSGTAWQNGRDPHMVTAYVSPNTGKALGVMGNDMRTYLAVVDLQSLLNAPRQAGTHFIDPSVDLVGTHILSFVLANTTTTALSSSLNPSTSGQAVVFTAMVTGNGGIPSGSVTFKDGAVVLGTGPLNAGTASFTTSSLSIGSHSITAVYSGDPNFLGSTSAKLTQKVNKIPTTTALSSNQNPSAVGQTVTFTAVVSSNGGTPTGTVTFKRGTTVLGTGTLSGGTASFSTSSLPAGSNKITAVYGGSANFTASSGSLTQVVH